MFVSNYAVGNVTTNPQGGAILKRNTFSYILVIKLVLYSQFNRRYTQRGFLETFATNAANFFKNVFESDANPYENHEDFRKEEMDKLLWTINL